MILGILSGAVVAVMAILAYLLLTLPVSDARTTPTPRSPVLSLPTASISTATPGPPLSPRKPSFVAREPVTGFSNCDIYGFRGRVTDREDSALAGVQVVLWQDRVGLLAIDSTNAQGRYTIELKGKPAPRKLWIQLYRNDVPVSAPLPVRTQVDCHNGFQVYQVNWQKVGP